MADLTESEEYTAGIYRFETTDPVQGGPGGIDNLPTTQLANRTSWLKARILELQATVAEIGSSPALPIGSIIYVPRATAPAGAIKCTGPVLSRVTYAALWAYAQSSGNLVSDAEWAARPGSFSTGDGSNTFRVPLIAGLVIRGYHDGIGTYETNVARALGSYQADDNKSHTHKFGNPHDINYGLSATGVVGLNPLTSVNYDTGSSGGAESRMRNVALLPVIYY
jgi:hypothetical protein